MTAQPADNWTLTAVEFAVTESAARYRAKEALRNHADPALVAQAMERFLINQRGRGLGPVTDRALGEVEECEGQASMFDAPTHREAMGWAGNNLERTPREAYGTQPRARNTDPATSHAAAASISREALSKAQAHVLALIAQFGGETGLSDEEIGNYYTHMVEGGEYPPVSPSGLRTRRKELVDKGLLRDSGVRTLNAVGNRVTVWALVR